MYAGIQALSIVITIIFGTFYGKKYGIGRFKSFFVNTLAILGCFAMIIILTWIESGFKNFGAQNAVRVFFMFALVAWIEGKIFKIDFRKCLDLLSILPPLFYGLGHLACIFALCCLGFQYVEGSTMYNIAHAITGADRLPMRLFESLSSLIIFVVILIVAKKGKYKGSGKLMAGLQIAFGAERFLWEFLRDNDKVIVFGPMKGAISYAMDEAVWGISNLALWAAACFVAGVILLIALNVADKKKAERELVEIAE